MRSLQGGVSALLVGGVAAADAPKPAAKPAEKAPEARPGAPAAGGDPMAQMKAIMGKYATPKEQHKNLVKWFAGKWKTDAKFWMPGNPEPMTSKGAEETKAILGGRFLQSTLKGDFMKMPFEGLAITGYDPSKDKFATFWADNMGTWCVTMEGTWDEATKTFTYTGSSFDPVAGKVMPQRQGDEGRRGRPLPRRQVVTPRTPLPALPPPGSASPRRGTSRAARRPTPRDRSPPTT